jgi:hypothetical protein
LDGISKGTTVATDMVEMDGGGLAITTRSHVVVIPMSRSVGIIIIPMK